jgi:glycerophosphoryl diester phosphodiesterase
MLIAHRGESYIAPENSLSAINLAWKNGAEAVEIDIHLTADNEIVVIHDEHTSRVGDKKYIIAESTVKDLKTVDIGKKKSPEFADEKIPTLSEVIETIPRNGKLIIEIKSDEKIIDPLSEILKMSGLENSQIEIIAFDLKVLSLAKSAMPNYKMLWLLYLDYFVPLWFLRKNPARIIRQLRKNNLDGVNVYAGKAINEAFVGTFKKESFYVYTWTVDDKLVAEKLLSFGVDAITTNRPAWLKKQLAEKSS